MRSIILIVSAMLLMAGYIVSPFFALHRIDHAIRDGDTLLLERYADWPAIREQLRTDLKGLAAETLAKQQTSNNDTGGSLASGLITLMAPVLVDRVVDANVNPDGVIRLLNDQNSPDGKDAAPHGSLSDWVAYSFFESPTEFRVDLQNPSKLDAPKVTALLEFSGLGWRVTRVKLPIQDLSRAITAAKDNLPEGSSPRLVQQPTATTAPDPSAAAAALKMEELHQWKSENGVSPLDKSPRVILAKMSQTSSDSEGAAVLGLKCTEHKTWVAVVVPSMIIALNEKVRIDYRIGDNQPEAATWGLGGDYKVVFAPSGALSVDLIKKMEQAHDFYIRITPERGDIVAFTFDLDGLKEVLEPLKVACHWDEQTASTPANSAPSKKTIAARVPKQQ
jgi:hypothetical protein